MLMLGDKVIIEEIGLSDSDYVNTHILLGLTGTLIDPTGCYERTYGDIFDEDEWIECIIELDKPVKLRGEIRKKIPFSNVVIKKTLTQKETKIVKMQAEGIFPATQEEKVKEKLGELFAKAYKEKNDAMEIVDFLKYAEQLHIRVEKNKEILEE